MNKQNIAQDIDSLIGSGICVRKIPGKRETWHVSGEGFSYFVKITYRRSLLRKVLSLLKLSNVREEARKYAELRRRGVTVPELKAYYCESGALLPQRELIITGEVEGSRTVKKFLESDFSHLSREEKRALILDFSRYIRDLHDRGVMHSDPNLGNFLVKGDPGNYQFYLLDIDGVVIKSSLSIRERLKNLSLLNLNFFLNMPGSLKYYFFKCYISGLIKGGKEVHQAIRRVESMTLQIAFHAWEKKIKKNRLIRIFRAGPFVISLQQSWEGNLSLKDILASPDDYLDQNRATILKDGRTVKAAKIESAGNPPLFLKRYNNKGRGYTLKNIFRRSRASKVWENSRSFAIRGLPIPSPLAFIEERKLRILKRSYIVSEFVEGLTFNRFVQEEEWIKLRCEDKARILISLAGHLRKMHFFGCLHGDLKWNNIVLTRQEGRYQFYFTDLDGSKVKRKLTGGERVKDIGRFFYDVQRNGIGPELQESFLNAYYNKNQISLSKEKFLIGIRRRAESIGRKKA